MAEGALGAKTDSDYELYCLVAGPDSLEGHQQVQYLLVLLRNQVRSIKVVIGGSVVLTLDISTLYAFNLVRQVFITRDKL